MGFGAGGGERTWGGSQLCHPPTQSGGRRPDTKPPQNSKNGGAEASGPKEAQRRVPPIPHSHVSEGILGWGDEKLWGGSALSPPSPPNRVQDPAPKPPKMGGQKQQDPERRKAGGSRRRGGGFGVRLGGLRFAGGRLRAFGLNPRRLRYRELRRRQRRGVVRSAPPHPPGTPMER